MAEHLEAVLLGMSWRDGVNRTHEAAPVPVRGGRRGPECLCRLRGCLRGCCGHGRDQWVLFRKTLGEESMNEVKRREGKGQAEGEGPYPAGMDLA